MLEADEEKQDLMIFQGKYKNLTWIPDSIVNCCFACGCEFSAMKRKVAQSFELKKKKVFRKRKYKKNKNKNKKKNTTKQTKSHINKPNTQTHIKKKKHHCRCCGRVFCKDCVVDKRSIIELGYTKPVRVCQPCVHILDGEKNPYLGNTKHVEMLSDSQEI